MAGRKKGEKVEIVNVRLPKKAISWVDTLVNKGIYSSRSEAIREFVREYLTENRQEGPGEKGREGISSMQTRQ